jgi:hypothetical protein
VAKARPVKADNAVAHRKRINEPVRIPTKSAGDSERSRPPVPIEAGQGFR